MLENQADLLKRHKARYLPKGRFRRNYHSFHEVIRELKRDSLYRDTLSKGREALAREFETADTLIISNESALLDGKSRYTKPTLYKSINIKIDRYNSLFEGYNVISYLTIRNWQTWLPSYYFHMVRQGESRSFNSFVRAFDPEELDWQIPAEALSNRLNSVTDHILTHEAIRHAPFSLVKAVLNSAGIQPPLDLKIPSVNKTYGAGTIHYMRFWNRVFNV